MSELLKINILDIADDKCVAKLESVHPDQTEIPCKENIAFQIVMEAYKVFESTEKHPWKEKMDKWLSFMQREKIMISEEDFQKYDSGEIDTPEDCSGIGWDGDNKYLMKKENNREFVRAANNEISFIELIDLEMQNELPCGKLVFQAFEAELFSHLTVGMTWDSALYNREYFM